VDLAKTTHGIFGQKKNGSTRNTTSSAKPVWNAVVYMPVKFRTEGGSTAMGELFNENLQKAGARYLNSQTALNYFSLAVGVGSIIIVVIFGLRLVNLFSTTFGF